VLEAPASTDDPSVLVTDEDRELVELEELGELEELPKTLELEDDNDNDNGLFKSRSTSVSGVWLEFPPWTTCRL
jgi:hypothetical protein